MVTVPVLEYRAAALREQQNQDYGLALARMAAQQAVDATLNHDLVSLQVILQDVVANPGVVLATIHDVENNLLVQSGDARLAQSADVDLAAHTAPITLHDSVAGYVSVTVASTRGADSGVALLVAALALLLLFAAGASAYDRRHEILVQRRPKLSPERPAPDHSPSPATTADATNDPEEADDAEGEDGDPGSACAQISVINLEHLQQQLSAEMFDSTCTAYQHLLEDVLPLYSGYLMEGDVGHQRIGFACTDSSAEAVFRAACSVYLVAQLARNMKPFPLRISATIGWTDEALQPGTQAGLWLTSGAADEAMLQNRLSIAALAEQRDLYEVTDFQQPYRALLDKQCHQLARGHRPHP